MMGNVWYTMATSIVTGNAVHYTTITQPLQFTLEFGRARSSMSKLALSQSEHENQKQKKERDSRGVFHFVWGEPFLDFVSSTLHSNVARSLGYACTLPSRRVRKALLQGSCLRGPATLLFHIAR